MQPDGTHQTTYTYDLAGRKTGMSDPDRGSESYSYDANGNLTESVDARGSSGTVYAGYDGLNRQVWRNNTNSPTGAFVSYSYDSTAGGNDGIGRLTGESFTGGPSNAWTGSYAYTYDGRGQTIGTTETINGTAYPTSMTYDDAGHLTEETYPDTERVQWGYTTTGWASGVVTDWPGPNIYVGLLEDVSYTGAGGAMGLPTSYGLQKAAGVDLYNTALTYDALGRLTDSKTTLVSSGATLFETSPSYDAAGNVAGVNTTLPQGTDNQAFCYDELDRLTWAGSTGTPSCGGSLTPGTLTSAQYTASYSYDNLDRLTSSPQGSYTYGDSSHLHAATAVGSTYTASYDASGDMVCRAPTSSTTCAGTQTGAQLSYDSQGQLSHWQNAPSSPTSTDDFLYDGEGHRVLQESVAGGTTTTTSYISNIEEVASSGSTTTTTAYYYFKGQRIALSVNQVVSYLLVDQLGSAEVTLNTSGSATASVLYGPYGQTRCSNGSMPGTYGFTGQHDDTALTGLDYYNARYYDPTIGQFASADTDASGGLNRYSYVGGNPETQTDPTGHLAFEIASGGEQCPPSCFSTAATVAGAVASGYGAAALIRKAIIQRVRMRLLDNAWEGYKASIRAVSGPGPMTRAARRAYRIQRAELEGEAEQAQAEADFGGAAARDIGILSAVIDGGLTFRSQWASDSHYGFGMRLTRAATAGIVHGALVGGEAYVGTLLGDAAGTVVGTVAGAGTGAIVGAVLGCVIGTFIEPGGGTVAGAVLGAEIGADAGVDIGAALGATAGAIAGATALTDVLSNATDNVASSAVSGVTNLVGAIFG